MLQNLFLCGTFGDHGQMDVLYFENYISIQKNVLHLRKIILALMNIPTLFLMEYT